MKNTEKSSFGGWKRELLDLKLQQRMCKWSRMSDRGNELYDFNGFGLLNGFWCITNYNKLHFNILLWLYHRKNIHCAFRSNIWVSEKNTLIGERRNSVGNEIFFANFCIAFSFSHIDWLEKISIYYSNYKTVQDGGGRRGIENWGKRIQSDANKFSSLALQAYSTTHKLTWSRPFCAFSNPKKFFWR